ncbi:hypothetical protein HJ590_00955 [Naumannella sp. ID2617S]|nr:hypothetical protein [Naumannella sp. ID2617S]
MTRPLLPMEIIRELKAFDPKLDEAEEAGDGARLAELWEELWAKVPTPSSDWDVQGRVSLATNQLIDVGNWEALRPWIPRFTEQYGADDPDTRILVGILDYNTGEKEEAHRILAGVLEEFGPTVFEGRKEYLRVAKGGQLS